METKHLSKKNSCRNANRMIRELDLIYRKLGTDNQKRNMRDTDL